MWRLLITDSGIIEPEAPQLSGLRRLYPGVRVYADILCKHASSLTFTNLVEQYTGLGIENSAEEGLRQIINDAVERGGADALIVTGERTGEPPSHQLLARVQDILRFQL